MNDHRGASLIPRLLLSLLPVLAVTLRLVGQLALLESSRQTVRGDETHLGGEAQVRSLERCLSVRTDAKAWAAALDTVVVAARDSFSSRRGRLLDAQSTPEVYEALLDLPGTY